MKEFRAKGGRFPVRLIYETSEIDDICLGALRQSRLLPSEPQAIKIDLFLERHFGVAVLYEDIGEGIMGSTVFDSRGKVTGFTIATWIEEDGTNVAERRVRSTLAHEGGHGLLHSKLFMSDQTDSLFGDAFESSVPKNFLCRSSDIVPGAGAAHSRYDGQWWEWQANRAIGGLLLPKPLVISLIDPVLTKTGSGRMLKPENRSKAEAEVAQVFDVNPIVARIRLQEMFPVEGQGFF